MSAVSLNGGYTGRYVFTTVGSFFGAAGGAIAAIAAHRDAQSGAWREVMGVEGGWERGQAARLGDGTAASALCFAGTVESVKAFPRFWVLGPTRAFFSTGTLGRLAYNAAV